MNISCGLRVGVAGFVVCVGFAGLVGARAGAQAAKAEPTVESVMLSDLHLDPFHDPAKVPLLIKADLAAWPGILGGPDSATQAADFAAVQKACKAKDTFDSPYKLLASALETAKAKAPGARFVTVSGDLLVHDFDCRYRAALKLPKNTNDDESVSADFAAETTAFVMGQVEAAFKGMPVYLALGNNDSRCNHNRLDVGDDYLKRTAQTATAGLVGVSEAERKAALATYLSSGYYGVTMAAPMKRTRLLVVDDIYMISKFSSCEGDKADHKGADEQIAWLTKELDAAKKQGERVWVLGHLPPGENAFSTLAQGPALCTTGSPVMFLSTDELGNALASHADVVKLGLFGHTHMDEMHLVGDKGADVPLKVVASVTPVDGNAPSFAVGKVSPASATLVDYTVYSASNFTGEGTTWSREYKFGETYHEANFTASSLEALIGRFHADKDGSGAESKAYMKYYFKGGDNSELAPFWQGYVCTMDHTTAAGFKGCVCGK